MWCVCDCDIVACRDIILTHFEEHLSCHRTHRGVPLWTVVLYSLFVVCRIRSITHYICELTWWEDEMIIDIRIGCTVNVSVFISELLKLLRYWKCYHRPSIYRVDFSYSWVLCITWRVPSEVITCPWYIMSRGSSTLVSRSPREGPSRAS